MLYSNYKEQFERVKRYQAKIHGCDRTTVDCADDLWSFFVNCWNLKDWVENDDYLSRATRKKIINEVRANETLRICAEMVSRSKHKILDKYKRKEPAMLIMDVSIHNAVMGSEKLDMPEPHYEISADDGKEFNAIEYADKCVKEWEQIFFKAGLQIT